MNDLRKGCGMEVVASTCFEKVHYYYPNIWQGELQTDSPN
jgi:hypothetical protein